MENTLNVDAVHGIAIPVGLPLLAGGRCGGNIIYNLQCDYIRRKEHLISLP